MSGSTSIVLEGADRVIGHMEAYERSLGEMTKLYGQIAIAFRRLETHWFASRGEGSWPALSPTYAAWKAVVYPGRPILVQEGELRDSLTKDGVISVGAEGIVLGTDVAHAIFHATGTQDMPARPPVIPDEMLMAAVKPELQAFISYEGSLLMGAENF